MLKIGALASLLAYGSDRSSQSGTGYNKIDEGAQNEDEATNTKIIKFSIKILQSHLISVSAN